MDSVISTFWTTEAVPWVPGVFSRLRREFSVLAEGRSHERRSREKNSDFRAGHYKDLIETVNLARKVSGTQGTEAGAGLR